jgi:hypothetical protein
MECRLVLTAHATAANLTTDRLRASVDKCLQTSAVAALLAALVAVYVGGAAVAAAQAVFVDALSTCLAGELANAVLDIRLDEHCSWTNWTAC